MFGTPTGRYFGAAGAPGAWVLNRNLQQRMPGPEVRVVLEPHPVAGSVVVLTIRENEAVTRGNGVVLACWLGFLVLVFVAALAMTLTSAGRGAEQLLVTLLVVVVLGGASIGVYLAARAIRRASAARVRRAEVEHFVRSLRAVPT
jgi:drug/metabolite transporter (DMT)-like permease